MKPYLKIPLLILLIGTILAVSVFVLIYPWSRLESPPETTFRRLVAQTVPASVSNIRVDGFDNQYSSNVTVEFNLAPVDRYQILVIRPYKKVECEHKTGECFRYTERGGNRIFDLYFEQNSNRVWFNYWDS